MKMLGREGGGGDKRGGGRNLRGSLLWIRVVAGRELPGSACHWATARPGGQPTSALRRGKGYKHLAVAPVRAGGKKPPGQALVDFFFRFRAFLAHVIGLWPRTTVEVKPTATV